MVTMFGQGFDSPRLHLSDRPELGGHFQKKYPMKLSGTQKTQWQKLKAEIVKRPLLAFIAGLSKEEVTAYLNDEEPSVVRLEEINHACYRIVSKKRSDCRKRWQ